MSVGSLYNEKLCEGFHGSCINNPGLSREDVQTLIEPGVTLRTRTEIRLRRIPQDAVFIQDMKTELESVEKASTAIPVRTSQSFRRRKG
jgi:hypothetical protein